MTNKIIYILVGMSLILLGVFLNSYLLEKEIPITLLILGSVLELIGIIMLFKNTANKK